jgi:hypothetical protein
MKSEQLTIMVTPAERERIDRQAAALGISASEYLRKVASLLDAQDLETLEGIQALLPEFTGALERIHENLKATLESSSEQERKIAALRHPEFRRRLKSSLLRDHWQDLDAAKELFGGTPPTEEATSDAPPEGGTLFERMSNIARNAGRAAAEDRSLDIPSEWGKKKA